MIRLKKEVKHTDTSCIRKYSLWRVNLFQKEIGDKYIVFRILGILIAKVKNKKNVANVEEADLARILLDTNGLEHKTLWIDHSLGGGTDSYSNRFFSEMKNEPFIRLQYFAFYKTYQLTWYNTSKKSTLRFLSFSEMINMLYQIRFDEIVVNNLVGYVKSTDILEFVSIYKQKYNSKLFVSFRGHDYHALCPSFNLLDHNNQYCELKDLSSCEHCFSNKRLSISDFEDNILRSGATTVKEWREAWSYFFDNTLDEFIAFSNSTATIFFKVYPQLQSKTVIRPHKVVDLPIANIKPHSNINIALLGNVDLDCKGKRVLDRIVEILEDYDLIYLKVVGESKIKHRKVSVTGKYQVDELPKIMEKEDVDIVLIPSICPETFSYTTSEAMNMGLSIACFELGAPYERVRNYSKGLILRSMDAHYILEEIEKYIKRLRDRENN